MKALALLQPWADAVVLLGKNVENRTWNTSLRGEFLVQASASIGTRQAFHENCEALRALLDSDAWAAYRRLNLDLVNGAWRPRCAMRLGGVVGCATLVDVLPPCRKSVPRPAGKPARTPRSFAHAFSAPCAHRWHAPAQYGFVLRDIWPTPFVPFKGAMGFVEVPDDVTRRALGGDE